LFTGSVSGAKFTQFDLLALAGYLAVLVVLGWRRGKTGRDPITSAEEYLLAGRRLSLPAFVASLVSTWYGGILGVGEFSYRFGIANWVVFGLPYYLYAAFFALFLAEKARKIGVFTIPDQLERHYGKNAALAGSLFLFILTLPAPYLLMLGIFLRFFLGIPLWTGIFFSGLFSLAYIYRSGLRAVVRTDVFQFALMYAGFAALVTGAVLQSGGLPFLRSHTPGLHWQWSGGLPWQYILVWYVIASTTLIDPNFHQRCYAARTPDTARRGIFLSILFWALFDFLTTTAGLYARAMFSELEIPAESYLRLGMEVLPPVIRSFFWLAILATIMSTLDSFLFVSAISLGRDFFERIRKPKLSGDRPVSYTRAGMGITLLVSVVLAVWTPSVVDLWYQLGSVATPALLFPLLASFSRKKYSRVLAGISITGSGGLSLVWMVLSQVQGRPLLGIEPILPGLLFSAIVWKLGWRR